MKITVEFEVGVDGAAVHDDELATVAENLVRAMQLTLPTRWNSLRRTLIVRDLELKKVQP